MRKTVTPIGPLLKNHTSDIPPLVITFGNMGNFLCTEKRTRVQELEDALQKVREEIHAVNEENVVLRRDNRYLTARLRHEQRRA